MRHQAIASAAQEGEPGVIAKSQKYIPSTQLSTDIQPKVVLVVSGSTSYFIIFVFILNTLQI